MNNYQIIRAVGKGSFGKVYQVRHKGEGRHYCCKQIKLTNIPRKERDSCRSEIRLMQKLRHPNIVGYKDSFFARNGEQLCIVMTYCDGGDLSQRVERARGRRFKEHQILHWFVQIALGLHFMHEHKVLHRDLKTQNIFLLGNGRLVLGDLGISKVLEGTAEFAKTCIGTPYYMSPELFKNKPYNHKSDVWALGCVLYELATLKHAFDANSLSGLAGKILRGYYSPIHSQYSRGLKDLIKSMLSINASSRPSLPEILKKPFVKKHVMLFFKDMISRGEIGSLAQAGGKIGQGTIAVRGAILGLAGQGMQGSGLGLGGNDVQDMLALKKQLEVLGFHSIVKKAMDRLTGESEKNNARPSKDKDGVRSGGGLNVRSGFSDRGQGKSDINQVRRQHREAKNALRREEERKRAVESALEKLRKEREARAAQREKIRERQRRQARRRAGRANQNRINRAYRGARVQKANHRAKPAVGKHAKMMQPKARVGGVLQSKAHARNGGRQEREVANLELWERKKREQAKQRKEEEAARQQSQAAARRQKAAMKAELVKEQRKEVDRMNRLLEEQERKRAAKRRQEQEKQRADENHRQIKAAEEQQRAARREKERADRERRRKVRAEKESAERQQRLAMAKARREERQRLEREARNRVELRKARQAKQRDAMRRMSEGKRSERGDGSPSKNPPGLSAAKGPMSAAERHKAKLEEDKRKLMSGLEDLDSKLEKMKRKQQGPKGHGKPLPISRAVSHQAGKVQDAPATARSTSESDKNSTRRSREGPITKDPFARADRLKSTRQASSEKERDHRPARDDTSGMSAREAMLARKAAKKAEEQAAHVEALKKAAEEQRSLNARAKEKTKSQYRSSVQVANAVGGEAGDRSKVIESKVQSPRTGGGLQSNMSRLSVEIDDSNKRPASSPHRDRYSDAARRCSAYAASPQHRSRMESKYEDHDANDAVDKSLFDEGKFSEDQVDAGFSALDGESIDVESDDEEVVNGSDEEVWVPENEEDEDDEEDEWEGKEDELRAELAKATIRAEELRTTLETTAKVILQHTGRSRIGKEGPSRTDTIRGSAVFKNDLSAVDDVDESAFDDEAIDSYLNGSDDDDDDEAGGFGAAILEDDAEYDDDDFEQDGADGKAPAFQGPADPPSPHVGKLSQRIPRLKKQCIDGLGQRLFDELYNYSKNKLRARLVDDDALMNGEKEAEDQEEEEMRVRKMLGGADISYWALIDQLIFAEEVSRGLR